MIKTDRAKSKAKKSKREAKAKRIGTAKPSLAKLKKKLWSLLSPAVKAAHPETCFTCDNPANQCGHMFPKGRAHALSAFHPGNLRPQDFYCNINLGGNGAEFARRYIDKYGIAEFAYMHLLSRTPHKWTVPEIEELIAKIKISLAVYEQHYDDICSEALSVAVE